jgi:predicted TIM-barrel fold metal-dependent hydrolase
MSSTSDMKPRALLLLFLSGCVTPDLAAAPRVDHHQHLLNATMTEAGQQPITAKSLISMLDDAGIQRAVILSNAFRYGDPRIESRADEYARVKAENDWTADEAAKYPGRLTAYCSFNPLKEYALRELSRCAAGKRFGLGIKLQFGSSDIDLSDPAEVAMLRRVFRAANTRRMEIVVHLRTARRRPYGAAQAHVVIDELLAAAPDVRVQIAHLAGGGGGSLDPAAEEVLGVFAAAFAQKDPRVKNLYFDLSGAVGGEGWPARAPVIAQYIRALGVIHVVYGSDGGDPADPPAKAVVAAYRQLPLSLAEFSVIDGN